MSNFKTILFAMILVLSSFLAACSNAENTTTDSETDSSTEQLEIYTTLYPIEDFTKKIGGDHVSVTNIIPVGSDPHSFEPTAKTMVKIAKGDAFIYNGAGMEGYVESIKQSLESEKIVFVEAAEGIELIEYTGEHEEENHDEHADENHAEHEEENHDEHADENHAEHEEENHDEHADEEHAEHEEEQHDEHAHGDVDMHVWLDPIRSITLAENIKNTLVELKPEAKDEFEENFNHLKQELETLDHEFEEMVKEVPNKTFIISHAAFGYWTDRYSLQQIGIAGLSPSNEPSQKQLQEIVEYANEYNIKHVLFEQNITSKVSETIKNEIGAESFQLHDVSVLTEEDINNNEDYFTLMRRNIETLRTVLQ